MKIKVKVKFTCLSMHNNISARSKKSNQKTPFRMVSTALGQWRYSGNVCLRKRGGNDTKGENDQTASQEVQSATKELPQRGQVFSLVWSFVSSFF